MRLRIIVFVITASALFPVGGSMIRERSVDGVSSVRDLGMGGASVTLADDASAIFSNPGLMPYISRTCFTFTVDPGPIEANGDYRGLGAFVLRDSDMEWAIGVGAKGDMTLDVPRYNDSDVALAPYNYGDFTASIGGAFSAYETYIGIVAKGYYTMIDAGETYWGAALDVGIARSIFLKGLLLGVAVKNLGVYYNNAFFSLDTKITAGIGFRSEGRFAIGLNLTYALPSTDIDFAIGGEYRVYSFDAKTTATNEEYLARGVYVRVGMNRTSPSIGLGIYIWQVRLDYALFTDSYTSIGLNHSFGLSFLL
ncbi:MAG: hypothetical protein AABZ39_17920 [Spirochaetota bacterium]